METLPSYVWALVLIGVIGIPAITCAVLYRGAIATGSARGRAGMVAAGAGAAWGGWLVVAGLLAAAGAFRQEPNVNRPWIAVAAGGALVAALLATRIPAVTRILTDPATPARLALPHTLRVAGVAFLIVAALDKLPAVFALPAGLGDMAIGLSAPFVARRLSRGTGRAGAVWFNVMGIVDLVVAVSIGFLAGLGPRLFLHVTPSTAPVALLPLALIPATAVPLAIALHLVSLARLRAAARTPATADNTVPVTG